MINKESKNKLEVTLSQIEKLYGKSALYKFSEYPKSNDISVIDTGSIMLNIATGINGVPLGRIVEIYGPESSGKTTLCLHIIAEAQKKGGKVAFIDAEHALDPIYASAIGVNMDEVYLSQPDYGEQALDIVSKLVESGYFSVIIVDSVAALVPKSEIDGEIGDSHMALQARMMSQTMRMITGKVQKTNTLVIFINQIRQKIGVMFGNPETTTGGNALKFYSSMRIDIRKIGIIKDGDEIVASRTRAKIVKSKVSTPFKEAEFDIRYGTGIDRVSEMLDLAIQYGFIIKTGAWFELKNTKRRWQGKENMRKDFASDKKLYNYLNNKLFGTSNES